MRRAASRWFAALRKCYNHPYLFEGLEHASTTYGEGFVEASGKLHVVDRLLRRRLGGGHRVVIFAGHTSTLDVLERLCAEREYVCARLDGATCRVQRTLDVRSFNASTRQQIFLCSTRAGGPRTRTPRWSTRNSRGSRQAAVAAHQQSRYCPPGTEIGTAGAQVAPPATSHLLNPHSKKHKQAKPNLSFRTKWLLTDSR